MHVPRSSGGRGWSEARAKPRFVPGANNRGFLRKLSPAPATPMLPLNSWHVYSGRNGNARLRPVLAEFAVEEPVFAGEAPVVLVVLPEEVRGTEGGVVGVSLLDDVMRAGK